FHQLLIGQLPFPEREVLPFIQSIRTKAPAPLPQSVPTRIQDVIWRVLEKEPSRRYYSASEMSSDLRDSLREIGLVSNPAELPSGSPVPPQAILQSQAVQAAKVPTLEIGNGREEGRIYRLEKDRIVLGRSPDCDVCLTSKAGSRYHAQLVR